MPTLALHHRGVVIRRYPLEGESVTIGRKSDNDIQLDDPAVSSRHARVRLEQSPYLEDHLEAILEDLDSTNGTRVNHQAIESQPLKAGDVIHIGHYTFVYESGEPIPPEQTAIFLPGEHPTGGEK
jgi:pSer/pThr/pTyr-binding forkhead associated (FHA) protein